jgi:phosphoglycerate kinase
VGKSLIDEELIPEARRFVEEAQSKGVEVLLPEDVVIAPELAPTPPTRVVSVQEIPDDQMGLDIGPRTIETFKAKIQEAKTLLWAGPLGAFETPPFERGTVEIARAIARSQAFAVVGGGDTAAALKAAGVEGENIYVSTGGGAALEFLGGRSLPALEILRAD